MIDDVDARGGEEALGKAGDLHPSPDAAWFSQTAGGVIATNRSSQATGDARGGPSYQSTAGLAHHWPVRGAFSRRPATIADRDFLWTLRRDAFREGAEPLFGWNDEQRRVEADAEFGAIPVEILERDGRPVGYICVLHREDHDFLEEIALAANTRNCGLGRKLVGEVMKRAGARGVPLRLSVLVNNPARRLYDRLGFRVTTLVHPRVAMEWS